jgi:hypothetical protein
VKHAEALRCRISHPYGGEEHDRDHANAADRKDNGQDVQDSGNDKFVHDRCLLGITGPSGRFAGSSVVCRGWDLRHGFYEDHPDGEACRFIAKRDRPRRQARGAVLIDSFNGSMRDGEAGGALQGDRDAAP